MPAARNEGRRRIAILPQLGDGALLRGLVLLHLVFADDMPRAEKTRLLGARIESLRDLVTEANRILEPAMLDALTPEQLVVESPERLAERLLA